MKTTKQKVKQIYDFIKSNCKVKKQNIELSPYFTVNATYNVYYDYGFEYEVIDEKYKFPKNFESTFRILTGENPESYADIDYSDYIDMNNINDTLEDLISEIGYDDSDTINSMSDYDTWTEYWVNYGEYFEEVKKPKIPPIKLTSQYDAIIDKKNQLVKVGCQDISIDKVREIIAEYDKN
jgi:uncharacterized protein YaaQ